LLQAEIFTKILPHFQRQYAWEKKHWQTLLNAVFTIYDAYTPDKEPEHFMCSLVVVNDGSHNGTVPAYKVVDGQQREATRQAEMLFQGLLSQVFGETYDGV